MRRGTTPTHSFEIPLDVSTIHKLRITYAQAGQIILTKTEQDITIEGNTLSYRLSQEETLLFSASRDVEIEIHILTISGESIRSDIMRIFPDKCLNDEVLK